MKYAIVFNSRTGNTKKLADTIAAIMPKEDCIYYGQPCKVALEAEIIFVGFWTEQGQCDSGTEAFLKFITNQKIFIFGTAGFGSNPNYLKKVLKQSIALLPKTANLIGEFICQGEMPALVRTKYEDMLKNPLTKKKGEMFIENFDMAIGHPNLNDLDNLTTVIKNLNL